MSIKLYVEIESQRRSDQVSKKRGEDWLILVRDPVQASGINGAPPILVGA